MNSAPKPGRNDPCPCGSGKKYKQCCLAASISAAQDPAQLLWQRIRRATADFPARMARFILETYGVVALDEAWGEFTLWDGSSFDSRTPYLQMFQPWMYHRWSPDPAETAVADRALHGVTPTRAFLDRKGRSLDPLLRQTLEACLASRFSFFDIEHCEPGHGFRAHDIFTGEQHHVLERSASQTMSNGDLLYGQIASVGGISLLEACSPRAIPPIHKIEVVELRKQLRPERELITHDLILDQEDKLRRLYLDFMERLLDPQLPLLRNTDGEDVVVQRLVFDIDSAQVAFDALKHLDFESTEAGLLEGAERDEQGQLRRVRFDWKKPGNLVHKGWTNTILGAIEIDNQRLYAQVNSKERAADFRRVVEQALGRRARYRMAEVQSADKLLAQDGATMMRPGQPDLAELPEIKAQLAEMMARHYEHWVHEGVPALGGWTPLAAMQQPDGREQVEALVRQAERDSRRMKPSVDPAVFETLRARLGLPP
ncbi:MAG: hypothetical protein JWQ90_28 [Hydrocarboniphaga sp.]|nr:hypothetical protein [Hydrocarboniphaga sp.]